MSLLPVRVSLALAPIAPLAMGGLVSAQESWLVRADTIHTASGDPIQGGVVVVAGGKVQAVGAGSGRGDEVIECAAVTPGLIDLAVHIDTGNYAVEQSTETPIALDILDAVDPWSYRFRRELEGGVTSVLLDAPGAAVLGGLGAVVKTGGDGLEQRIVKRHAVLHGTMGSEPSDGNIPPRGTSPRSFYYRRPTTRMGVEWVLRKSFHDAEVGAGATNADSSEEQRVLRSVLAGELPLGMQAWTTQDIRTAVFLKEEFGIPRMFVDSAAEAWKEPELLVRSGMGVVLPPWDFAGRTGEMAFYALDTAAKLHALGVPVALSGQGRADASVKLARQPGFAMRGGLSFDAALQAVTIVPARLAGVDDRIGSLEVGKDADLVLWSGQPFEPTSRITAVFVNGKLLVDHRQTN